MQFWVAEAEISLQRLFLLGWKQKSHSFRKGLLPSRRADDLPLSHPRHSRVLHSHASVCYCVSPSRGLPRPDPHHTQADEGSPAPWLPRPPFLDTPRPSRPRPAAGGATARRNRPAWSPSHPTSMTPRASGILTPPLQPPAPHWKAPGEAGASPRAAIGWPGFYLEV